MGGGSSKPEANQVKMSLSEIQVQNPFLKDTNTELFTQRQHPVAYNSHIICVTYMLLLIICILILIIIKKRKK